MLISARLRVMRLRLRLWVSLEALTRAVAHECMLVRMCAARLVALPVTVGEVGVYDGLHLGHG